MRYRKPTTVYLLKFDDRDGLEVRAASVPLGRLLDLTEQVERFETGDAASIEDARELFDLFASSLRSWNLEEEDGTATPADMAGIRSLEFGFAAEILMAWFKSVGGSVPSPLARRSTVTLPSEVPSIPMELLSPGQQS